MCALNRVKNTFSTSLTPMHVGWREWIGLPELCTTPIKAKVDTGARSSALHAFHLQPFQREGDNWLRFDIHPILHRKAETITVEARKIDERSVRSSNGITELRPVIRTFICLGHQQWPIEITLTNRDTMGFRMLLGRQTLRKRCLVDPGRSYVQGQPNHRDSLHQSSQSSQRSED